MTHKKKIKVLIVDDSATVRQALKYIFDSDPFIEVVATAMNPYFAAKKIIKFQPDVITLDIQMPEMDGITFLKKIMSQKPIPVIIISSYSERGSINAIKALENGAVDVLSKPLLTDEKVIEQYKKKLCNAVKVASVSKVRRKKTIIAPLTVEKKYNADIIIPYTPPSEDCGEWPRASGDCH